MFNFGTVTTREPEINEVTKEELLAQRKTDVWTKRILKVAGEGLAAIGTAAACIAGAIDVSNKILEGHDESNPAGFCKTAVACGVILTGAFAETAALMGGAALIESEVESWSDDDFKIPEIEAEDDEDENIFDPDNRVEFDFLR